MSSLCSVETSIKRHFGIIAVAFMSIFVHNEALYVLNVNNVCVCCCSPGTSKGRLHPRTCWSWWTREWRPHDSSITVRFYFLFARQMALMLTLWLASSRWALLLLRCAHGCLFAPWHWRNKMQSVYWASSSFYSVVVSLCGICLKY